MARFNEILVGRFNRFLQRYLSMKGGPPAAQLASEIAPNLNLEDATNLENRWLMQVRSYGLALTSPAVAAQLSAARIANPAGSGAVIVVEKISGTQGAIASLLYTLTRGPVGGGNLTAPVSGANRDLRQGSTSGSVAQLSVGSAAANTGAGLAFVSALQNTTGEFILDEDQEIVVMPNDILTVWSSAINTQVLITFFWRERALEEGELT